VPEAGGEGTRRHFEHRAGWIAQCSSGPDDCFLEGTHFAKKECCRRPRSLSHRTLPLPMRRIGLKNCAPVLLAMPPPPPSPPARQRRPSSALRFPSS
jgi:hypothetical protein